MISVIAILFVVEEKSLEIVCILKLFRYDRLGTAKIIQRNKKCLRILELLF
jgi:hypothetical protein